MLKSVIPAVSSLALFACTQSTETPDPATDWQTILAEQGLAAAEAVLIETAVSPDEQFVLGGIQFLRASEAIMQVRYQNSTTPLTLIPGMRNELPTNLNARFDPAFIERAMTDALIHLARADSTLSNVAGESFEVDVFLPALWFDINQNGSREEWETVVAVMEQLNASPDDSFDGMIRFDTADAHWLKAYVHVMSGMAVLTLATDPTPAIRTVFEQRRAMDALGETRGMLLDNDTIDTLAAVLLTLRGVPDAERTRAAHAHFKDMIAENRAFWSTVMDETDNVREWLPNPDQTSAFGVEVSAEMADGWQAVLVEIEQLLEGETLVPYWRFDNGFEAEAGIGVNVAKFLQNPGDLDIIL